MNIEVFHGSKLVMQNWVCPGSQAPKTNNVKKHQKQINLTNKMPFFFLSLCVVWLDLG